jgi:hypothetical protein
MGPSESWSLVHVLVLVDGNPFDDIAVIDGGELARLVPMFTDINTIRAIIKDRAIYKKTLWGDCGRIAL